MDQQIARTTLAAFFATVVIGGTNFVAVKFSNAELPPLYGAGVRFAAAALIFFAITRLRRMELPRGRALVGASIYGVLSFGVAYALLYFALLGISAGMTSVILASVPLLTLVLAVMHGQERFTIRGILGGLLAMAGIAVLSYQTLGGEIPLVYLLAAVGGALAAAEATVLVKGFPKSDPITTNAVGMAVGAAGLIAASAVFEEAWVMPELAPTWISLAWLAAVGSVGLFGLFLYVVKTWTASASVYALTLMPVVAVSLGALLIDETITAEVIAGAALVSLGVYVGALSGLRRKERPAAQAPAVEEEARA